MNYNLCNITSLLHLYLSKKVLQSVLLLQGRIICADGSPNGCLSNVFLKISNKRDSTTAQTNPFQYYPYCWKEASPFPVCLT